MTKRILDFIWKAPPMRILLFVLFVIIYILVKVISVQNEEVERLKQDNKLCSLENIATNKRMDSTISAINLATRDATIKQLQSDIKSLEKKTKEAKKERNGT